MKNLHTNFYSHSFIAFTILLNKNTWIEINWLKAEINFLLELFQRLFHPNDKILIFVYSLSKWSES